MLALAHMNCELEASEDIGRQVSGARWEETPAYDNALMKSFFGSMQIELLDRSSWATTPRLVSAILHWNEGFC